MFGCLPNISATRQKAKKTRFANMLRNEAYKLFEITPTRAKVGFARDLIEWSRVTIPSFLYNRMRRRAAPSEASFETKTAPQTRP
jgi:hypothetical protein